MSNTTNSSLIKLYNLEGEFDETLRQYKQAYLNYFSLLQNSNSKYTSVQNTDFLGIDLGAVQNTSVNECQALCSTNPSCYGFTYDTKNNTCYPKKKTNQIQTTTRNGVDFYIKNQDFQTKMNKIISLNSKLISINQKIKDQINSIQPTVIQLNSENTKKLNDATTIYNELIDEKNKIEKMKQENTTVNTESVFSENNFQHQIAQYFFWTLLSIIILLLTLKAVIFPNIISNPLKILFWIFLSFFIFISILYAYLPTGFLILCVILAYISLGFMGILPLP